MCLSVCNLSVCVWVFEWVWSVRVCEYGEKCVE